MYYNIIVIRLVFLDDQRKKETKQWKEYAQFVKMNLSQKERHKSIVQGIVEGKPNMNRIRSGERITQHIISYICVTGDEIEKLCKLW